jgi:hypothetical protein
VEKSLKNAAIIKIMAHFSFRNQFRRPFRMPFRMPFRNAIPPFTFTAKTFRRREKFA